MTVTNRHIRYTLLLVIIGLLVYLALGYGTRSFEAYCPFGGAESLWGLITQGEFTCALGPLNLSIMLALLGLALLSKKSFCGWACPIGLLGELGGKLGGRLWRKRPKVEKRTNGYLKLLRYVILVVVLYFTYHTGELILRGFDPFYLIFSGFGHGSLGWISIAVLGGIVVAALVVPMAFCRYLCPLGAVFDPFSRLGLLKVSRDDSSCTACGMCTQACPHEIGVDEIEVVRHRDCTNCLECVDVCPEDDVLSIRARL
ncbi:4Fe-4S binding protein [candidate division GN15 bacterium]|nr:4Fe-4S binding protein [candidate division GN15 bacterium]